MSTTKFDTISSLKPGRYDYRIHVRIIRKWRVATRTGEVFKNFNILLIDKMQSRIHAFIPGLCAELLEPQIQVGKVYSIKKFTVQNYKQADIYRCLKNDTQLILSKDTQVQEMEEQGTKIQFDVFDFNDHSELKILSQQKTYLADVVGIIKNIDFRDIKTSQGKDQLQAKLTITDGSSNVNVTFWAEFVVNLQACMNQGLEKPVIIIISSGKVGSWNNEVEISNVAATRFYLNYKHHSVIQLRRKLSQPQFAAIALTQKQKRNIELFTVDQITKLGKEYIDSKVMTHVKLKHVEDTTTWFIHACTTCDTPAEWNNALFICKNCPRTVPHPDQRYKLTVVASDSTGVIDIILGDREVRTLIRKRARDLYDEVKTTKTFPQALKDIGEKDYTVVLQIKQINVVDHYQLYWATNICNGFVQPEEQTDQSMNTVQPSSSQATTSTYHLQGLSELNFQSP